MRPEPSVTLPKSISPRLRYILARSRLESRREGDGVEDGFDPPLHVLSEDKYGEVVLERLAEEVELPVFQELGGGDRLCSNHQDSREGLR